MVKKKLRDAILLVLEKSVDGIVRIDDFRAHYYRYHYGAPELNKSALAQALKRLREHGFIEKQKDGEKIIFKLTEAGRDWLLKNKPDDQIEWDGVWRLVIFDIPESYKRARNTLRRRLKDWGFSAWQKSVWASKKPLTTALRKLVKELGIDDWVLVIESSGNGK